MIDDRLPSRLTARHGDATAVYYYGSRRVMVIADKDAWDDAAAVLEELRKALA